MDTKKGHNDHEEENPEGDLLKSMKGKNAFQTPEGYFDDLRENVMKEVRVSSTSTGKSGFAPFWKMAIPTLALFVAVWFFYTPAVPEDCLDLACLPDEALVEYLENIEDEDLLYEVAGEMEIEMSTDEKLPVEELNDEEADFYLDEYDDELDELLNE